MNNFTTNQFSSLTLLLLILFLASCQNPNPQLEKELAETKSRLVAAKAALETLNSTEANLVHEVYFNLKDDLTATDKAAFHEEILKLKDISVLKNLVIGDFKNLNDQRAFSDYEIKVSMMFKNEKEYAEYQAHPIHLALKKAASAYLAAPPATYDFVKK